MSAAARTTRPQRRHAAHVAVAGLALAASTALSVPTAQARTQPSDAAATATAAPAHHTYRQTGSIDVGSTIADMAVDSKLGAVFTVDGRVHNDSNPADDADLSVVDPAAHRVVRKVPVHAGTDSVFVDELRSRLYTYAPAETPFLTRPSFTTIDTRAEKVLSRDDSPLNNPGYDAVTVVTGNPRGGLYFGVTYNVYIGAGDGWISSYDSTEGGGARPADRTSTSVTATPSGRIYVVQATSIDLFPHGNVDPEDFVVIPTSADRVVADEQNHLLLLVKGSRITALDDRSFKVLRTGQVPGGISDVAVDPGRKTVYVTGPAGLTVISETTGTVTDTIRGLGALNAVEADTKRHSAYVSKGSTVYTVAQSAG